MIGAESSGATGRHDVPSAEQLPPLVARTPLAIFDEAITLLRIRPWLFLGIAALLFLPARGLALLAPGADLRGARLDRFLDVLVDNIFNPDEIGARWCASVSNPSRSF